MKSCLILSDKNCPIFVARLSYEEAFARRLYSLSKENLMPKPDRSNYRHVIDLRGKQNADNYLRAGWDDKDFSDAYTERRN